MAINAESKSNLLVFTTFAKRATTRQKQDYQCNETREDCVLNRPMVDKENHVCSMGHKIAFIL